MLTEKDFNTNFKTETVLTNAYACLDRKSKLFETNLIAIETKELLQRKIYVKNVIFFTKWHVKMFINSMNGGYEMTWKLRYG